MRPNYAVLVRSLPADGLEDFVNDWLAKRVKDYHSHELWRGTGDMGRDVTGYVTERRMEGPWDNFQCKQLSKTLSEPAAFVELGKIFMHAAAGEFSLPRAYTFVAPRGVGRAVQAFIAHPERFRQAFLDRWDTDIAKRLVDRQEILLTPEIRAMIVAFNFNEIHWLDSARLVNDPACKPALVKWFGDDPGPSPRGMVPDQIQSEESPYVGQLLRLYEEKGPGRYPDAAAALASAEHGTHLRDQRTRFFDAVAFDRFYRDSTPDDYLMNFKDEIYHGVVETHGEPQVSGLARLTQVMKLAAILQPSGILGKHAGPPVKQGTCHQFANEGRLPWHR
ncbi:ABC-three component system protein [Bradyrhizobium sp. NAS80.1]|uniref:ABC-three component system protein n=1 Tax=Bradyrhizobium sp. NAS80.1 TaxID=1680159 RepID=UPI000A5A9ECB|nr:ABC-three component system protein [Bradyrhizobium sp. NAS80.1]